MHEPESLHVGSPEPHRQVEVPGYGFTCDEDITGLIAAMNDCLIGTLLSCQDNNAYRGSVRRVWVMITAEDLVPFLEMVSRPGEDADLESLSNRVADRYEPDDWEAFREDRAWHYDTCVDRDDDGRVLFSVSVRFPFTDLPEVVRRLEAAEAGLAGAMLRDDAPSQPGEDEICAVCAGCGAVARGEFYSSILPDGTSAYWASQCTHEYEVGDVITCRCGMLCPSCQDPADLEAQRRNRAGE